MSGSRQNWIELATASRVGEVSVQAIKDLAARGMIRTRDLPNVKAKYFRADVEALARPAPSPAASVSPSPSPTV